MLGFFLLTTLHWLIGLLLTGYVWACGAVAAEKLGFWRTRADVDTFTSHDIAIAYPLGLLWAFVAATAVTIPALPGILGLAIILAPAPMVWSARARVRAAIPGLGLPMLVGSIPGIVAAGVWHGATRELPARYMFDTAHYAGRIQTVLFNGPFGKELSVEGVSFYGRMMEQGPAHIGAALAHIPGFDPFLFYSAVAVTLFGASTGICLSVLGSGSYSGMKTRVVAALLIGVLMAGSTKYPSWLVESPPVAFALPLGFSALCVIRRNDLGVWKIVLYGMTMLGALYLSKVLAAVFFAVLLIPHFVRSVDRHYGRANAVIATSAVTAAAAFLLGINADIIQVVGQSFWLREWTYAYILNPVNLLLALSMVAAILILPATGRIAAVAAGATYWILPSFINLSPGLLLQMVSARGIQTRGRRALLGVLALMGAVASITATRGRNADILLFMALAAPFALAYALSVSANTKLNGRLALASIVAAFAVSMAVARPSGSVFTPAKYSFWTELSGYVPRDAIVFTDQTGPDIISLTEGANYLSSLGGRQLYIGGWAYLANDTVARRKRLEINGEVVTGVRRPGSVALSKRYANYFAVLDRKTSAPSNFQPVFSNSELALYRILDH